MATGDWRRESRFREPEVSEPQRRRASDSEGGLDLRVSLVEHGLHSHVRDCETRQNEIKEMFGEVRDGLKAMGERLNKLHVQWLTSALGLVGSAAVFLFGKVMKWW